METPAACGSAAPADRRRRIRRPTAPAACRARRRNPVRSARTAPRFSAALRLPAMMRQSETRRLMYCQICSLNSGWFRICLNTDMSGSMRPITRRPGRFRNTLCQRARAKGVAPLVEAGRRCGKRGEGMGEQGGASRCRIAAARGASSCAENQAVSSAHSSGAGGAAAKPLRAGTSHPAAGPRQFWTASAGP